MKIGLFAMSSPKMLGGALLKSIAANAERLGFATMWVPEHVVLLDKYASKYPYSQDGVLPAPPDQPLLDPFLALACWRQRLPRFAWPPVSAWCRSTIPLYSLKSSHRWIF